MRELLWVLIVGLFAYALFQLYRAWTLRRAHGRTQSGGEPSEHGDFDELLARSLEPEAEDEPGGEAPEPAPPRRDPDGRVHAGELESRRAEARLQRDLDQLREELGGQRERLGSLERAVRALRDQLESSQAVQGVSPEYNEALVCARRGLGVGAIAERCGISVAEAELVKSLVERSGRDGQGEREQQ